MNSTVESIARVFYSAWRWSCDPFTSTRSPTTFPVIPHHIIYNNDQLLIGLSLCPATAGHTLAIVKQPGTDLFSLHLADFVELMFKVSTTASILGNYYGVGRCALVTEGGKTLSLLEERERARITALGQVERTS